jgi:hypothetical protein
MADSAAAQSTVDALLFSLRSGTAVLSRQDVRRRLTDINENQVREICALLQKREPRWSDDELEKLLEAWTAVS